MQSSAVYAASIANESEKVSQGGPGSQSWIGPQRSQNTLSRPFDLIKYTYCCLHFLVIPKILSGWYRLLPMPLRKVAPRPG